MASLCRTRAEGQRTLCGYSRANSREDPRSGTRQGTSVPVRSRLHRVASLLGESESYWSPGFPLHHSGTGNCTSAGRNVAHPKPDEVAHSQLAIAFEIEERQIPRAMTQLETDVYRPDLL